MDKDPQNIVVPGCSRLFPRSRVLFVLLIPLAMSLLAVSSVNVILPAIEGGLRATATDVQWVLSGYALSFGVTLVPAGRLGDVLGRGTMFVAGLTVFSLASLACGLAPTPLALNGARLLQGVGAGLFNPQTIGMIQQYFSGQARARAFSLLGLVVSASVAVGPLLAGAVIELVGPNNGWRASFFYNVPIGVLGVILALRWLPFEAERARKLAASSQNLPANLADGGRGGVPAPTEASGTNSAPARTTVNAGTAGDAGTLPRTPSGIEKKETHGRRGLDLDPLGTALMGAAVLLIMWPFMAHSSAWFWFMIPAGLLMLFIFVLWERRYRQRGKAPMLDLSLFSYKSFSNSVIISGIYFLGASTNFVALAIYLQTALGVSAFNTGLIGLPNAIASAFASIWTGKHVIRRGRTIQVVAIGLFMLGTALSMVVLWLVTYHGFSYWWFALTMTIIGVGQGAIGPANLTLSVQEVPPHMGGVAGGVKQTAERMGTAIGNALVTGVLFMLVKTATWHIALLAAFATVFTLVGVSFVFAVIDRAWARRTNPIP